MANALNDSIESPQQASLRATSPDRLMHGEDPETRSATQVEYWIGAYTELLAFKEQLLRDIESGIDKLSQTAGEEIRELDVSIIQLQQKRYRARLGFWLARRTELAAAPNQ
jgi:hypothetical protein